MAINDWDINSPSAQSPAGQGDDEIRAIKTDVQTVFPAVDVEIQKGVGGEQPTSGDFTQLFDDVESLLGTQGAFPIGAIIMWAWPESTIPVGWTICDGTNVNNQEVPDMRNIFPWGAGGLSPVGTFGGSGTTSTAPKYSVEVTVDDHIIVEANLPRHTHSLFMSDESNVNDTVVGAGQAASVGRRNSGGGDDQKYVVAPNLANPSTIEPDVGRSGYGDDLPETVTALTHNTATVEAGAHTHNFTPSYHAVYFIMYVGTEIVSP